MKQIDPYRYYAVIGEDLQKLHRIKDRLYDESKQLTLDEKRDLAIKMDSLLDHFEEGWIRYPT